MKESFIAAVLRYYSTYLRYLWPAVILTVGLGIVLYFWRSRERRIESFHRYVRDDVMLMAWTVVFGAVFFGLDRGRVWISVLLMIACILLILLAVFRHTVDWRFSIHVVFMLLIVARLWGGAFWDPFTDVVYIALSVLSVAAWAGTVSDLLLFLDRRRLYLSAGKPPEQTAVDQMECRHLGVTALMTILVMAVLILPSDLNFVYLSGHVYDDPIVIAAEAFKARKTTQQGTDPAAAEGTDAASHVTVSDRFLFERSEMLDLLKDYIWPFDTSPIHGRNGNLNMHTIEMRLLEDRSFDNVLLEDICALTRGNKINPSLLFVNSSMLGYGNDKSRTFPIDPVTLETAPAPLPQRAESSDTVSYMRRCFAVLLQDAGIEVDEASIGVAQDGDLYYTYLGLCSGDGDQLTDTVSFLTIYLSYTEENGFTGADYSLLQFIDLNGETEERRFPNLYKGLDGTWNALFGDTLTRDVQGSDMILTQEDDMVYFRKCQCRFH